MRTHPLIKVTLNNHRNPFIKAMTDIFLEASEKGRPLLFSASKKSKLQDSDNDKAL